MIAYRAGRVLAGDAALRDGVVVCDGPTIAEVTDRPPDGMSCVELGDVDLIPGLVDLHSDCFEELAHPRPSASLPIVATFAEYDALVVTWGITTNYLCVNLDDDARKWRTLARAYETEATLRELRGRLRADHRIHLRVDITTDARIAMTDLARGGLVGLVSYMDHTPGSGQFATEEQWRTWYGRNCEPHELDAMLAAKRIGQGLKEMMWQATAAFARETGAVLASHDDDTVEKVAFARTLGVRVAEFPVTPAAARVAIDHGLGTVMGAPNARRGHSHVANLSAREALAAGVLDALTSDYHPPSMLGAAYALVADGACSWERAIGLVASGPARIVGLEDRGTIAAGKRADFVAVDARGDVPVVRQTWIAGIPAFGVAAAGGERDALAAFAGR